MSDYPSPDKDNSVSRESNRKNVLLPLTIIFTLVVIAATALIGNELGKGISSSRSNIEGASTSTAEEITLELKLADGSERKYSLGFQENTSVFEAIENFASMNFDFGFAYEEYSFGKFITKLAGVEVVSGEEYWAFYVNGVESSASTEQYILQPGDVVRFELKPSGLTPS